MSDVASPSLSSLTREQKNEALKRTRDKANIQDGTLVLIFEPLYDEVVNFMIANFVPHEPISKALSCNNCPDDWKTKLMKTLSYNLSTAILNDDGDIMAVDLVAIGKANEKITTDIYNDNGFKALVDYMLYCDAHAHFYTHFGAAESFHINEGTTAIKYRNKGLGSTLFAATLNFFQQFGIFPVYVKVEASSNFAKLVIEKQGFEILYEKPFSEYTVDGEVVIKNTGEHKSVKVYGKRIDMIV